eukprot:TRINITY_DN8476_c0_g1_i1.p1 TRINITY_DN8476_c0_g1~~TRINITY_DN8476_c0_g1_i1.p1  ORF type:complete len:184 (+),score=20.87 TRINITY_DN8476_c0_g1_i1:751-1302(+)
MDHHCPFTACCIGKPARFHRIAGTSRDDLWCVGEHNNQHFFMFVTYGWIATIYATWLSLHPYQYCLTHETAHELDDSPCNDWTHAKPRLLYISIAALALMTCFWLFLVTLRSMDMTIIEFLSFDSSKRRNQDLLQSHYRAKGVLRNHEILLGPWSSWWRWLLPVRHLHKRNQLFGTKSESLPN